MKVQATLSIGYPTATKNEILEFDDDLTEEEIEDYVTEWANEHINIGWRKV